MDPVVLSRLHFAFTAVYHYLFPPLTMGLALLLVLHAPQYVHTILGAVITGVFVMAGVGAYYLLLQRHEAYAKQFVVLG